MKEDAPGFFSAFVENASHGTLYRYRIGDDVNLYPDPASRFQPTGPHGPSCVIDPFRYSWGDQNWHGVKREAANAIYEMHIGTFTREGTFRAAAAELSELSRLGVTVLQIMPVADFPGRYGWGYDGVNLFAPTRLYGEPDDFRHFVDTAHKESIAVILDVVYNHIGPEGNYLSKFSSSYAKTNCPTEWGNAINFDQPDSGTVRDFVVTNAGYWIEEFHLDGLRFDSVNNISDASADHIMIPITKRIREAAGAKSTLIVAENESQEVRFISSYSAGGYDMDIVGNDDFHHSAAVVLTGRKEAYYTDYRGSPQEFVSAFKFGFLYQGQYYTWQRKARGTPALDIGPSKFMCFLENHDQVANSLDGKRLVQITSPALFRLMSAVLLMTPGVPLLFQGQEFGATSPFLYFTDLDPHIASKVWKGRIEFLSQFPSLERATREGLLKALPDGTSFNKCKIDFEERNTHKEIYTLYKDLLKLRQDIITNPETLHVDGAVLGTHSFVIRYFGNSPDKLLVVNFGIDHFMSPAPEPLLAPPAGYQWNILWHSEDIKYGGRGIPDFVPDQNWIIPGMTAIVLGPSSGDNMERHYECVQQR
jgi:maltooligosyltrehalose trehalohydrolase